MTLSGQLVSGNAPGAEGTLPGTTEKVQVVGKDGPCEAAEFNTHTGFYVRKYNDTKAGSGDEKTGSEVWFIRYRFGEVLLNAAEAAFELDQKGAGRTIPPRVCANVRDSPRSWSTRTSLSTGSCTSARSNWPTRDTNCGI